MKGPKYILRVDNAWRVKIKQSKCQTTKQFNFDKYCGIKRALAEAVIWRDRVLCDWGMFEALNYEKSPDYHRGRKSQPCIGIFKSHNVQRNNIFYNWTASVQINNKANKRHFSINKYGEVMAFRMACAHRYKHSGTIVINNKRNLPSNPGVPFQYV